MQICCTKKLQDEMGIVLQNETKEEDLFCWSVHLITVNRRKTIVVVNDSNRFGFVLYGLKAKQLRNLDELLIMGIRNCLRDEKIKEEIVEKYLKSGGGFIYAKTRGSKYVARLNKGCELVKGLGDSLELSELFQTSATRIMNKDIVKMSKESDYHYPYELLSKDLKIFAGEEIVRCEAVDLIVKLKLYPKIAWRRIITPINTTFKELHEILQVAFDWKDYHLYEFNVIDDAGKYVLNVISEFEEVYEESRGCKILLDSQVDISEYTNQKYRIVYCYDYGDNWEHEITIQGVNAKYDKNYPTCVMGGGNTPPEDVGGITGYKEFLKIMKNPNHDEYENTKRWAQGQRYKDYDSDSVNRRLKNVLRR
ncbi:plasmid pRiA4b ORF-3 family protein [Clostridium estertheticum]|uniref:Plasmid pRiA4b ORF-3 family protein n=1 Tax=Clostridium estertheticum TaxID=238834 RepID=A0A5N7IJZ0_9CLOT|nr:plasmid pRiA4b ORF-3 family protein [Clostridium estertheticum]MPQ30619.1 plasmid pRiA4b ORF-3 family protein [Clostridium estertheticum]MPQ61295.1 plasmid pRiA4b ORF-3 family protein [Clostridium estertheticum]